MWWNLHIDCMPPDLSLKDFKSGKFVNSFMEIFMLYISANYYADAKIVLI